MTINKKQIAAAVGVLATAAGAYYGIPLARNHSGGEDTHMTQLRILRIICVSIASDDATRRECVK